MVGPFGEGVGGGNAVEGNPHCTSHKFGGETGALGSYWVKIRAISVPRDVGAIEAEKRGAQGWG